MNIGEIVSAQIIDVIDDGGMQVAVVVLSAQHSTLRSNTPDRLARVLVVPVLCEKSEE